VNLASNFLLMPTVWGKLGIWH